MKKTYVYDVAGFEFTDDKAFGTAWQEAKVKAKEFHTFITRTVVREGKPDVKQGYANGIFLELEMLKRENLTTF